jgi:hypothetical protein
MTSASLMSLARAGRMGGENPILKCKLFDAPGNNSPDRRIKRPEVGELFRVGYRLVRQERRRLRDWLNDDRNAQNLLNGLSENVIIEELSSLVSHKDQPVHKKLGALGDPNTSFDRCTSCKIGLDSPVGKA